MYILLWNCGTYETFDSFLSMLRHMKEYNKAGLFNNIDFTWKRIDKPQARIREYVAFDEF